MTWIDSPDPFLYTWVYEVPPERVTDFLELYGSDGAWCELFARAEGYLGTETLEDRGAAGRFATIDRWESRAAFDAFRVDFAEEFDVLDRRGEEITASETPIGEFGPAAH